MLLTHALALSANHIKLPLCHEANHTVLICDHAVRQHIPLLFSVLLLVLRILLLDIDTDYSSSLSIANGNAMLPQKVQIPKAPAKVLLYGCLWVQFFNTFASELADRSEKMDSWRRRNICLRNSHADRAF